MLRWAKILLLAFIILTKPDGGKIWIAESHIVAIFLAPGIAGAQTAIVTDSSTVLYVQEKPEDILKKLERN